MDKKFSTVLDGFLEKWEGVIDRWYRSQYTNLTPPTLQSKKGKKYIKISKVERNATGGSVEAFIDMSTGDIFKPASYSAPAKHARGNIFSDDNGMEAIDAEGDVRYLRG